MTTSFKPGRSSSVSFISPVILPLYRSGGALNYESLHFALKQRRIPGSFRNKRRTRPGVAGLRAEGLDGKSSNPIRKALEGKDNDFKLEEEETTFDEDRVPDEEEEIEVLDTDLEERRRRVSMLERGIPKPRVAERIEVELAPGKVISFETGRIARHAAGAVVARSGDTIVYCTVCCEEEMESTIDFLPLRVDYTEKFSACGRTSGSYTRREGRPNDYEIVASRLIDRPLRPMFQKGYYKEVQILANVFSFDNMHEADTLAICGCAAALHISQIPLTQAVAGVKVGHIAGKFIINPTTEELKKSDAELVVAGTRDSILMIEGTCDFFSEEKVLEAVEAARESIRRICDALDKLRDRVGKEKDVDVLRVVSPDLTNKVALLSEGLDEALKVVSKREREEELKRVRDRVFSALAPDRDEQIRDPSGFEEAKTVLRIAWKKICSSRMRHVTLESDVRPDGRNSKSIRPISIDQGVLPSAHGSSIFTRGETQALAVATLGPIDMAKRIDRYSGEDTLRFYLQYSFPPFSVGEVGRVGAPGRREIGHGKLAERALSPVIPSEEEFPYVIRLESNILESNGSSSMASVCGGCLAMMDAGVPIKRPVAGIAMGLIYDEVGSRFAVLSDILGLEDALGDMDFKVAGDAEGITALQMDSKVEGITVEVMKKALAQAKEGRSLILGEMLKAMPCPRPELHASVPRISSFRIPVHRIGDVIGPGGKSIKSIIEKCGGDENITINISDEGLVSLASSKQERIDEAAKLIQSMAEEMEVGQCFNGKVTKILPFGAYIELAGGKEAWLHISELENKRTERVEDVCKEGDSINVTLIEVGRGGQLRVSRKACLSVSETDETDGKQKIRSGRAKSNGPIRNIGGSSDKQARRPRPSAKGR